ncbi:MAG: AMP-binding protein [Chloroflexi bacterium]|nr:AMP-binding protein [Chloroflexota bacterium]
MIFTSPYPDRTIPDIPYHALILQKAMENKDVPALIDGPSGRTLTFGQVAGGARLIASSLSKRGFGKGDVFAICLPNLPEYAVAFHATLMLGGVVTTANPLYTPEELAFQLNDTQAKYLLTIPMFLEKAAAAAKLSPSVKEIFVLGEAAGATPFASLLQSDGQLPPVQINPREDLAVIPYSSGTSGRPKGVMLTHHNLVAITIQADGITSYDKGDRTLGVLPFYHIYGMVVLMNFPMYKGGECVTLPRFDLEQFLQTIEKYKITHLYLVPPIILALAKHPLVDKYNLKSVKLINSGAAPLDESVQKLASQRIGCLVTQGYGMTETSLASHVTPDIPGKIKAGSSGFLLPNMQCKIIDVSTGAELGPNQRGEICVRGPNIMRGYLNNTVATDSTLDKHGWLHTGDVGFVDDEGHTFVVDRVKELIKYKGMQVAPAELEGVLLANPAVADVAVIPSPDEEAGEVPKAFVVLKSPGAATPDELMAFVAGRVAPHKKIRRLAIVDSIPKSASGKILRRLLVEQERAAVKAS